jgi:hypothetical protein
LRHPLTPSRCHGKTEPGWMPPEPGGKSCNQGRPLPRRARPPLI